MKIEAGKNLLVLDFGGDTTEEDKVFLEISKAMIDKKLQPNGTVTAVKVKTNIVEDGVVELKESEKVIPRAIENPTYERVAAQTVAPRQKYGSVKEFLEAQDRKLVIGVCECEKQYSFWVNDLSETEHTVTCKRCETEKKINLHELVPATYKCEKCGKQSSFWMEAQQSVAIDCVACGEEVDMYYHDKKKIMTNSIE